MNDIHRILIVAVASLTTILIRFLPFVLFSGKREVPPFVTYLGKVLPYSVMAMLVVFCLKDVNLTNAAASAVGVLTVIAAQVYKRNTLFSIVIGTVVYMALIRLI